MRKGSGADMTRKTSSYRNSLLRRLSNPAEAEAYLNAGLDDSLPAFLKALKNVMQAHQMSKVAEEAGVQRETLYRSFSERGNPTLATLSSVLAAMGLKISVERSGANGDGPSRSRPVRVSSHSAAR
jgi:probable addiction module antidote protein